MIARSATAAAPIATPHGAEQLPASVVKILEGALRMVGSRGVRRLSMSDISDASGVSRGTLYRYFSTKDDVLEAVGEFICSSFETGVRAAAEAHEDPVARFSSVMQFFAHFTAERSLKQIFELESTFHLSFFRSHFGRHKAAVRGALDATFDHLEKLRGIPIDREATVEMLVRMQLSTLIVPADLRWTRAWENAPRRIEQWVIALGETPTTRE